MLSSFPLPHPILTPFKDDFTALFTKKWSLLFHPLNIDLMRYLVDQALFPKGLTHFLFLPFSYAFHCEDASEDCLLLDVHLGYNNQPRLVCRRMRDDKMWGQTVHPKVILEQLFPCQVTTNT